MTPEFSLEFDRRRTGWWLVAAMVIGIVGLFFLSFIGTFIFGLFVYYGARPINRWIQSRVGSRGIAATVTLLFIVLPTLTLLGYTGFVALQEFTAFVGSDAVGLVLKRLPGNQQSVAGALQNLPQIARQLSQFSGVQQGLTTALRALGTISNALLHLTLALTFAFSSIVMAIDSSRGIEQRSGVTTLPPTRILLASTRISRLCTSGTCSPFSRSRSVRS